MGCKGYRWAGRQDAKGTTRTSGLGGEEGTRAQTTQPLSYIPCPVGVRENTSSVSWDGKWLFKKTVSYKPSKKSQRKPQQKFPSLKYLASAVGLAELPLAPAFLLLWPGLARSCGSSLSPQLPQEGDKQEAGVCRWASRYPWVPIWKLESLVTEKGKRG